MSVDASDAPSVFVDSNVWLYAIIESPASAAKTAIARTLVNERRIVSTQVINEICVNLLRKASRTEDELRRVVRAFYSQHSVEAIDETTIVVASELRESCSLSYWDSLIVSSALQAGATTLLSEDMHHDQQIGERLRIVNPFRV